MIRDTFECKVCGKEESTIIGNLLWQNKLCYTCLKARDSGDKEAQKQAELQGIHNSIERFNKKYGTELLLNISKHYPEDKRMGFL